MDVDIVSQIIREALYLVIQVSAPILLISMCVGLCVSIFQTMTSIQEQTLTFVPKVLVTFITIILLGNWMGTRITDYMTKLWGNFTLYIR
ncbi:flagellar biosynthesis protein FliQ [Butyrivibrio sp. NC3005]|jgi:flagellar biosynthetic protein FliQ|uniref:flagellar biosynthesis protein FliQ n=1 Tax=Butyrivibrio sp. NC3005 TaxID=1280685 RepID=UPI000406AB43|nr:flagellar biosynthesis protein FliQ [Butyrivibrio sp. NC3005]